jgi:uncharacterized small protein (DUF1192 family)
MAKVIDLENATEMVEEVAQVYVDNSNKEASLNGVWDDESVSIEDRIKALSEEIQRLENESVTKRYPIQGGLDVGMELKKYVKDRVKWRFTDAFLVVNLNNEIEQAIKECRKTQVFEITGIWVEPLLQTLQSAEGVGLDSAKVFYEKLLVPISDTVNFYRKDMQLLQNLKLKLGSLENGLPTDIPEGESDSSSTNE